MKEKIIGIGIDIEEISRFKKLPFSKNKKFYKKIFTEKEIKYCLNKSNPHQHLAVRFCAKEAMIKAFPQKIKNVLDIEIIIRNGKPEIKSHSCKNKIHLSLSHTKNYAIAIIIIEKNERR